MSHSAFRRHSHTARLSIGLGLALLSLTACTQSPHQVAHRGLSSDGYGFVENGPTLAPPEHLLQHQAAAPTPGTTSSNMVPSANSPSSTVQTDPKPSSPTTTAQP